MSFILKDGREIRNLSNDELHDLAYILSKITYDDVQFNEWYDIFEIFSTCRNISEVDKWDILKSEYKLIRR